MIENESLFSPSFPVTPMSTKLYFKREYDHASLTTTWLQQNHLDLVTFNIAKYVSVVAGSKDFTV